MDSTPEDDGALSSAPVQLPRKPPTALQADGLRQRSAIYQAWVNCGAVSVSVAQELFLDDVNAMHCDCTQLMQSLAPLVEAGHCPSVAPGAAAAADGRSPTPLDRSGPNQGQRRA